MPQLQYIASVYAQPMVLHQENSGKECRCYCPLFLQPWSLLFFPISSEFVPSSPRQGPLLVKVKGSRGMSCTEAVKADGYFVHKVCVSALFFSISISWHTRTAHILLVWEDKSVSSPWAEAEAELLWRRFSHLYCTSSMKSVLWKSACLGSWLCH